MKRGTICLAGVALIATILTPPSQAYVEIPYSLGRLVNESTNIMLLQVEKVEKGKNLIVYRKIKDLKGEHKGELIKHNIAQAGFSPREWQTVMAWAEPGKTAVFFHNGSASETCIDNYWYQAYTGEWWNMSHSEPFLLRSYAGKPTKLAGLVTQMLEGKEVLVPCMVDGDKNALQNASARVQRLKASLKIMDYDPKRDFQGWGGNEDFRRILGMPAFNMIGAVGNTGPDADGVAPVDFDNDGKVDVCLFGGGRTVLMRNEGAVFAEVSLPYAGPARSADWGDYDQDGKPDLLLATAKGPKLLANRGDKFVDVSDGLPQEGYFSGAAAAFINADGDANPDIVFANGFLGLRLYRNLGAAAKEEAIQPAMGEWHYIGPFDNEGGKGFETAYGPENGPVDVNAQYPSKGGKNRGWKKGAAAPQPFVDGQVNNLAIFSSNDQSVAYVFREIVTGPMQMPISLGSDDTLTVWLNGEKLVSENVSRGCTPDSTLITLPLKAGKNQLLIKVCNGNGAFGFYFQAKAKPVSIQPLFADESAKFNLGPHGVAGRIKGDRLTVADFDGDGRQDFLYSADQGVLVRGTAEGFKESPNIGLMYRAGGVTPLVADLDGDKKLDVLVPQSSGVKLFRNLGAGKFSDVTAQAGDLSSPLQDVTSAALFPATAAGENPGVILGCLRGPNRYFRNVGGKFTEAGSKLGLQQQIFNTRGLAVTDLNKDGAADLVLNNDGQDATILIGNPEWYRAGATTAAR